MPTFNAKPHTIEAVQFNIPFLSAKDAPQWLLAAHKDNKIQMTYRGAKSYLCIYNKEHVSKAFVTDWICLNSDGVIFIQTDNAFKKHFAPVDSEATVP
jgi:hypothetical protein